MIRKGVPLIGKPNSYWKIPDKRFSKQIRLSKTLAWWEKKENNLNDKINKLKHKNKNLESLINYYKQRYGRYNTEEIN